ncbi:PREDICTED: meiotic nuclear division protein 1 homolog [Amphimedon queenslandica]|uniref:Meiotic nuclear division protein 1 homolog n=1 Tax=Amphimedon queenslandica TaxID=400682 RepID=A0A1X7UPE0_AMPQE|nr:PREDICTED: meiotic nuclear division protein 1 homolog [Amphimedon queenslandica]|eukprot:XP_011404347.1 PREDICTED: meiotic nuclear division protein 1 homolog [Amphimedon queenslandica]
MSKRKGLSLEEKRQRLLQIFYEKKEFFQLKELEKIAPKEKGITLQSVKDVLQSLVDDGLVDSERIGTSNYFWSFPSKASNIRKRKRDELKEKLESLKRRKVNLEQLLKDTLKGREETAERTAVLESLEEKNALKVDLKMELDKYKHCDPEAIGNLQKETVTATEATNRWTENVFTIKSWCKNKFGTEESTLNSLFNIPEELDYI